MYVIFWYSMYWSGVRGVSRGLWWSINEWIFWLWCFWFYIYCGFVLCGFYFVRVDIGFIFYGRWYYGIIWYFKYCVEFK